MTQPRRALVTGVTGYIGSRLVPRLLEEGWRVRALTRDDAKVADRCVARPGRGRRGRRRLAETLGRRTRRASTSPTTSCTRWTARGTSSSATATSRAPSAGRPTEAGVGRIVYLSGLHPDHEPLSDHLASRVEVGDLLMASGAPTAVLQAAVIIGSGSASFEMLRHLTTRLPVMVTPKWLDNRIQPIAVRDVLHYLVRAADLPPEVNRTFDIGGPDVLTYREMIQRFADDRGADVASAIVTVPVLTPYLASQWVGFVTPVPTGIAKPLVGSLLHEVVCAEHDLDDLVGPPPGGAAVLRPTPWPPPSPATTRTRVPSRARSTPRRITAADPAWAGGRGSGGS